MEGSNDWDCDHSGWVYKQGSLVKNWKKRFMVLQDKQLTYYDTDFLAPHVKERGSFQVITAELSSDIQNGLLVHGRGGRVLKLYTDTAAETSEWYTAIIEATTNLGARMGNNMLQSDRYSMLSDPSTQSVVDLDQTIAVMDKLESATLDEVTIQHAGWLMKEGLRVKSWKRRFFCLRGNTLSYFASSNTGKAAKGSGLVTAVEVDGQKKHSLGIRFVSGRTLRVTAKSQSEMQTWLVKLSEAIEAKNADDNIRQSMKYHRGSLSWKSSRGTNLLSSTKMSRQSMPNVFADVGASENPGSLGSFRRATISSNPIYPISNDPLSQQPRRLDPIPQSNQQNKAALSLSPQQSPTFSKSPPPGPTLSQSPPPRPTLSKSPQKYNFEQPPQPLIYNGGSQRSFKIINTRKADAQLSPNNPALVAPSPTEGSESFTPPQDDEYDSDSDICYLEDGELEDDSDSDDGDWI